MRHRYLTLLILALSLATVTAAGYAAAAPKGRGDRGNPYPLRATAVIPDSDGWKVRVNKSMPNATAAVRAENQFNDPPAAGRQFFIVNVTVTYTGKGSEAPFAGLTFYALGRSNVAYDQSSDGCGVVPNELDSFKKVFKGGKLTGNVCFSVRKSDARSLLLMVEPGFSFEETQIFFRTR
jgi:hypothetical protein